MPAEADAVGLDVDGEGGRHGDGRGDADRRQTTNPTLPDGTEVLWQPDNGMQPDWLQDFAGATGKPTFDDTDYRPVDYFQRTFPTEFVESLCIETNRYYAEWAQNPNANEQIKKAFTEVDIAEMKAFIAILITMGLSRRRSYKYALASGHARSAISDDPRSFLRHSVVSACGR